MVITVQPTRYSAVITLVALPRRYRGVKNNPPGNLSPRKFAAKTLHEIDELGLYIPQLG
jgi:hypothetical protein